MGDDKPEALSSEQVELNKHLADLVLRYPWDEDRLRLQLEARDEMIKNLLMRIDELEAEILSRKRWDPDNGRYE